MQWMNGGVPHSVGGGCSRCTICVVLLCRGGWRCVFRWGWPVGFGSGVGMWLRRIGCSSAEVMVMMLVLVLSLILNGRVIEGLVLFAVIFVVASC